MSLCPVYSFTLLQQGNSRGVKVFVKTYSFSNLSLSRLLKDMFDTFTLHFKVALAPPALTGRRQQCREISDKVHFTLYICCECEQNGFLFQVDHLHNFIFFRFSMGFVDSLIAKCKKTYFYFSTAIAQPYSVHSVIVTDLCARSVFLCPHVLFHCRRGHCCGIPGG